MALIKRLVKGSPLTFQEGDDNLQYLEDLALSSSADFNNWTGSSSSQFAGTSSFAATASYAINAGAGAGFPFSGSAVITGSLLVTGSTTLLGSVNTDVFSSNVDTLIFTGSMFTSGSIYTTGSLNITSVTSSLHGTASWAQNALTTSYAENLNVSGSIILNGDDLYATMIAFSVALGQT
jgi:hypothetical protein